MIEESNVQYLSEFHVALGFATVFSDLRIFVILAYRKFSFLHGRYGSEREWVNYESFISLVAFRIALDASFGMYSAMSK